MFKLNGLKDFINAKTKQQNENDNVDFTITESKSNGKSEEDSREMFLKSFWSTEGETNTSEASDPWLPNLSKSQRIIGFFLFLFFGAFCFVLAGFYAPFILLKARKFVMLYTMGSLFTIGSFALLWGPYNHLKHIFSYERLPFTTAYFGSMLATLYAALWWKSTTITVICACFQIMALAWYIFSYIPGGVTGLKFFSKLFASACTKTISKTLPV